MSSADCTLEHVFDIEVLFGGDRTIFGPLPGGGHQGYTPATGGTISGPRLSGTVIPHSGADYALVRDDGTIELNAHYLLQADDGTTIYIQKPGLPRSPRTRRAAAILFPPDALFPGCLPGRMTGCRARWSSAAGNVAPTPTARCFAITR